MASVILLGAFGAESWTRTVAHHWSSNGGESKSKEEYTGQHDRGWDNYYKTHNQDPYLSDPPRMQETAS